jgi:hypothetical protein
MNLSLTRLPVVETDVVLIYNIYHFGNGIVGTYSVTTTAVFVTNLLCPEAVSINKPFPIFYSTEKAACRQLCPVCAKTIAKEPNSVQIS